MFYMHLSGHDTMFYTSGIHTVAERALKFNPSHKTIIPCSIAIVRSCTILLRLTWKINGMCVCVCVSLSLSLSVGVPWHACVMALASHVIQMPFCCCALHLLSPLSSQALNLTTIAHAHAHTHTDSDTDGQHTLTCCRVFITAENHIMNTFRCDSRQIMIAYDNVFYSILLLSLFPSSTTSVAIF